MKTPTAPHCNFFWRSGRAIGRIIRAFTSQGRGISKERWDAIRDRGADKQTGAEKSVNINALDIQDAQTQARKLGLLVSKVTPRVPGNGSPPQARSSASEAVHAAAAHAAAVKVIAPDYLALKVLASVFRAAAFLCYIVALLCIICIPMAATGGSGDPLHGEPWPEFLIAAMTCAIVGILYHGASAFLLAFRDLVRNSFR